MQTLMKCSIMLHFIWIFTVCQSTHLGVSHIQRVKHGLYVFYFPGVKMGEACTVVLRGATQQILDEAERSLHDALCVLTQTVRETKTVFGGGKLQSLSFQQADWSVMVLNLADRTPKKFVTDTIFKLFYLKHGWKFLGLFLNSWFLGWLSIESQP